MATSTSNWPIRKTQNQIILVPTPHTCVLRVLIENNSNLNVWKLSIADILDKNKYILVPPPTHTTGDRGFSITNGQRNLETPDFVEKIRIFGKYPNRIWINFSIKIDQIWELLIQLKNQDFGQYPDRTRTGLVTPLELMWGIAAHMGGRHYPTDVIALIFRNYLGHCLSRPEITTPPLEGLVYNY